MTRQTRFLPLAGAAFAAALLASSCAPSSSRPDGRADGRAGGTDSAAIAADSAPLSGSASDAGGPVLDTLLQRPGAAPRDTPPGAPAAGDGAVRRLEREARALATVEGCGQADQCRTAPLGSRPCGGPRAYLVYCPLKTDSAALFRKLEELARAEEAYNRKAGMVSTCEFRMPPTVDAVGGRCVTGSGPGTGR
jgi:hypothetical protein